jgi:hypothetical protein
VKRQALFGPPLLISQESYASSGRNDNENEEEDKKEFSCFTDIA